MNNEELIILDKAELQFRRMWQEQSRPFSPKEKEFFDYVANKATCGFGRYVDFKSISSYVARNAIEKYKRIYNQS